MEAGLLAGTVELAEQMMDMPAQRGDIKYYEHIPDSLNSIDHATALGLALYGLNNEPMKGGASGKVRSMLRRFEQWITKKF